MKNINVIIVSCLTLVMLFACSAKKEEELIEPVTPHIDIPAKIKQSKQPISQVTTIEKKMALTFNGLADEKTMHDILNELDRLNIKATFFLQGMKVAEEPELASEILERGHSIQNNTLNHVLPDNVDYEESYVELMLTNKIMEEHLNIKPKYARTRSGDSSKAFEEAAAQLDMDVVTYSINPKDGDMKSAKEIADYVSRFATRGAIIELNTYINPEVVQSLPLIYKNAIDNGYELTMLEDVLEGNYVTSDDIESNKLAVNKFSDNKLPNIIKKFNTNEKEIALTFDDWASDNTISTILDMLDEYNIKSTFFLIGNGVETNPSLARLILERGHEVASHSYHHKVITDMKTKDLQDDIIKNDIVLTDALQEKPQNYFRPAQGIINDETAEVITDLGVDYIILYDVASLDWDLSRSQEEIYDRVITQTKRGSIITMHILDESHTIEVLPQIIETLQHEGYSFKTISEMIARHHEGRQ